jgi:hypothetical protein
LTDAASLSEAGKPARAADLDLFKTVLVWGMITAHCIQLLAFRPKPAAMVISDVVNLITFSGFMFAFGWGLGLSRGARKSWWARLYPVVLLGLATWVSEFAFMALVDKAKFDGALIYNILTFSRLYGWSEFLASFFVLYAIIAVARPWLIAIGERWYLMVPAAIACLAATWIVVSGDIPLLATIVGTTNFASFPIVPYLPWFLLGIFYARNPEHPRAADWVLAAVATGLCALWTAYYGEYPGRFPPTVLWIVGPALILMLYLVVARFVGRRVRIPRVLLGTGRHVLAALLVSNLIIFGLRYAVGFRLGQWWWTPILAISIIATVTLWAWVLDLRKARQAR